jgi:hypothetical protein
MSEQNPQSVQQLSPLDQMRQFIIGMIIPQAIHVAAKLDLADRVEKAPATIEELVAVTGSRCTTVRAPAQVSYECRYLLRGCGREISPNPAQRYSSLGPSPVHAWLRHPVRIRIGLETIRRACHHGCDWSAGIQSRIRNIFL